MIIIDYYVHGTSTENEAGVSSGWSDCELSERGISETKKAAAEITGKNFDLVYCSDLRRAKQSAEILFGSRNLNIIHDKRLRECNYGIYNGRPHENLSYLDFITTRYPEGESLIDVQNRIEDLLNELKQKYKNKRIAFVSHRAPQLALNVILNKMTWEDAINRDWRTIGKWQAGWEFRAE